MRITGCELLWLNVPFKRRFAHARKERTFSDAILIVLEDESGERGFGEILARGYVTGESNDQIFSSDAPCLVHELLGRSFDGTQTLVDFVEEESVAQRWGPAMFGGFELALLGLCAQVHGVDWERVIGPPRNRPTGKCLTVGLDCPDEELRQWAIRARFAGATVVKIKVADAEDARRIRLINEHFQHTMRLRLDANGSLSLEAAVALLKECSEVPIVSLEEPFDPRDREIEPKLETLFRETGIPLVADESLCTLSDAGRWIKAASYQVFNVRVGKNGGLIGASKIIRVAQQNGIELVAGTMVGESAVLNQASELLLAYHDELSYVEGLGQNRKLLVNDPVEPVAEGGTHMGTFRLTAEAKETMVVGAKRFAL